MLTNKEKREIGSFRKKAQKIVDRIAIERDNLRNLLLEYEDILNASDDALDEFESGLDIISGLL